VTDVRMCFERSALISLKENIIIIINFNFAIEIMPQNQSI